MTACAWLLLAALAFLAIRAVQPPPEAPASARATDFSAARALEDLKAIAQRPHPTGSEENDRARAYLVERLQALGLEPQVQTATVARTFERRPGPISAATVHNILARLPGTNSSRPIMLVAHYDSVPTGPGASDDGAGVVALLETLRAVKAGPPLKNDLILLITDGEERGLLGAKAFADEHPWAKLRPLALNFEARGSCGPSSMFETSAQAGWLVRQFAQAAPRPVASSLFFEAYKRLPNDTDFSIFKRAGMAGLNFAYAGCWPRYHTWHDDVEDIDPRSLQHHGSNALALARSFGNLDLTQIQEKDLIYFTVPGAGVVSYPQDWAVPLAVVALAAFATVLILGARRRIWQLPGVARVFGWVGASFVASALVAELFWRALTASGAIELLPYGMAYKSEQAALGILVFTAGLTIALYMRLQKTEGAQNLAAGGLLWWAILALAAAWLLPGGGYLFLWPLVFALFPMGAEAAAKGRTPLVANLLAWFLPAGAAALLLVPILYLLLSLLSTTGLILEVFLATLLVSLLAPFLDILTERTRWLVPSAAALVGLGLVVAATLTSRFDTRHPRADSAFYFLDSDTGKAYWLSRDPAPDAWTSQLFPAHPGNSPQIERARLERFLPIPGPALAATAPAVSAAPPTLETLEDLTLGDSRLLRLRIGSLRQAHDLWLVLEKGEIRQAKLNGKPLPRGAAQWALVYAGLPKVGLELTLEASAHEALAIRVIDVTEGLPSLDEIQVRPRPSAFMPSPTAPFDSTTLVSKTFQFATPP